MNSSVRASADDLNGVLLEELDVVRHQSSFGILVARARVEEADLVLNVVVDVLRVDWDRNVVVLLLQSSESSDHFALLVWLEVGKLRRELHLILILVGHLPLVLQRDARLVLNVNLLLRTDAFEDRREEELGLIRNHEGWLVTVAHQRHLLHIRRVVVEHHFGCEIVVPRRLGSKLKAHNSKGLALDEANMWIGTEGLRRILMNLVVDWRIRGVLNLDGLVN